ncbi:hypothetical protein [Kineosporia succinea]|uniref:Uncharacterized protein n=1 Tax=Kineosporia succinea TaxID=84632 RepID=A0ABT9P753_9ACTN|nr:hypothetical protein [Kineosporia succinea]MDP9828391.1 hypothetical protein [Kineosporia succinea]
MATGTEGLVTGTPARAAPVDDAFAELVYADHDLLCAEFDEIVETLSGRPPSSASHRRASAGTTERESADIVHTRCNCAAAFFGITIPESAPAQERSPPLGSSPSSPHERR